MEDLEEDALLLDNLRRMLALLGAVEEADPTFADRVREQRSLYQAMAIAEPSTLRKRLQALHADSSGAVVRALAQHSDLFPRSAWPDLGFHGAAQSLFHFIDGAAQRLPPEQVHAAVVATMQFDWRILRARLIEAMNPADDAGFERRARTLADVLRDSIEKWYGPILALALRISLQLAGRGGERVPTEIGALTQRCRDAVDVPSAIVFDGARIVRNSVAHSNTEMDLEASTVTFANYDRQGARTVIGPLDWEQLLELSDRYLIHCWGLTVCLIRQRRLLSRR